MSSCADADKSSRREPSLPQAAAAGVLWGQKCVICGCGCRSPRCDLIRRPPIYHVTRIFDDVTRRIDQAPEPISRRKATRCCRYANQAINSQRSLAYWLARPAAETAVYGDGGMCRTDDIKPAGVRHNASFWLRRRWRMSSAVHNDRQHAVSV